MRYIMRRAIALLWALVCIFFPIVSPNVSNENTNSNKAHKGAVIAVDSLLLVSTLDGYLHAVSRTTGQTHWRMKADPVLRVPADQGPGFLPDPKDGSLYLLGQSDLKKLPFTIPELVAASPCKSSEGMLYTGYKKDVWYAVDPLTGAQVQTLTMDGTDTVCPSTPTHNTLFLGRTEYTIVMFDSKTREKRWNATFIDYAANIAADLRDYSLRHFASSSDGQMITLDGESGETLWTSEYGSPVVAMYAVGSSDVNLHKVPYYSMATETLNNLLTQSTTNMLWHQQPRKAFYPTLYIGTSSEILYALPALVDENTVTIAPRNRGPLLLECKDCPAVEQDEYIEDDDTSTPTPNTSVLLLGYHEVPEQSKAKLDPTRQIAYQKSVDDIPQFGTKSNNTVVITPYERDRAKEVAKAQAEAQTGQDFRKEAAIIAVAIIVVALFYYRNRQQPQAANTTQAETSAQTSIGSTGTYQAISPKDIPPGYEAAGKILYDPEDMLGQGSQGTCVLKGRFDGREVAVKRVLANCIAEREVALLKESDLHPNVIRYFCTERMPNFVYIALELCHSTLQDYVCGHHPDMFRHLNPISILQHASEGLAHLHSISIVHRDVKPANVLLSSPDKDGSVRTMISDFGLCKKIAAGRQSLSQRTNMAGTLGWIAPEMHTETTIKMTCAVDIFSLGCVFYYVLSKGDHPFGEHVHRQSNISTGKYNLDKTVDNDHWTSVQLIKAMIRNDPTERPKIKAVLKHAFFWSQEKTLRFFQEVSDRIEKLESTDPIAVSLETNAAPVIHGNWKRNITEDFKADLNRHRTYNGTLVRDLLRAIRNKKHHYRELSAEIQASLGAVPDQFTSYFTSRFPRLLPHVYEAVRVCCEHEAVFRDYFEPGAVTSYVYGDDNEEGGTEEKDENDTTELIPDEDDGGVLLRKDEDKKRIRNRPRYRGKTKSGKNEGGESSPIVAAPVAAPAAASTTVSTASTASTTVSTASTTSAE